MVFSLIGYIIECSSSTQLQEMRKLFQNALAIGHNMPNTIRPSLLKQLHAIYITRGTQNPSQWLQLIKDLLYFGFLNEALIVYTKRLPQRRHRQLILPLVIKICASLSLRSLGECLHCQSVRVGLDHELLVGTTFVSMYCKCGDAIHARKLFDEMPYRNVVTYNAMIGGYSISGDMESASALFEGLVERTTVTWGTMIDGFAKTGDTVSARRFFDKMSSESRNVVTWTIMVHGYAVNGQMDAAREMFERMPGRSFFVWSSMISGYFKKGNAEEARAIFDRVPERNLVIWNALIAGYAHMSRCEEALDAFRQMQEDGFKPDEYTIVGVLSACSQLGSLEMGKKIHELIIQKRINMNQFVLNGLVDMYAKCGDLERARRIFDGMRHKNVVCWNAMISGLASHGRSQEALQLFDQMEESEGRPNNVTFLVALSACTHGGFVDKGLDIIARMEKYELVAGIEHYGCLVDLLGRAGRLSEAYNVIKHMPMAPNETVWGALLGACRIHADKVLADRVMNDLNSHAESNDEAKYIVLSSICAASEEWEESERLWRMMVENGIEKVPACSSIVVDDTEHKFHAGAFTPSRTSERYCAGSMA